MNKIFNSDCLPLLQKWVDKGLKVDCIITDPPYEINYLQNNWDKEKSLNWNYLFYLFDKLTKPESNIIIFQGWSSVCNTISCLPENLKLKDWIIYDRIKGRGAKTQSVSTREDILWITKGNKYIFNKIPSTIKKKTGGLGLKNGCEFRALSNVWTDISPIVPWSKEKVNHPTQKPVQLMERCIKLWTNPNNIVLDPFMGSGTTGVACKNLGRNFIGIEKMDKYFEIAQKRISECGVGNEG